MSVSSEDVFIIEFYPTDPKCVISKGCLAAPGDLALIQINLQISVEGYTLRHDNSSYWQDPSFSGESWKSPFHPTIILSTTEKGAGRHSLLVVSLTKLTPGDALSLKETGVDSPPDSFLNLSAYVFPHATEIRWLPSQVHLCIFFNASQLIYKLCRHRCVHSGSYLPPPLIYYGRSLTNVCPCSITERQRITIRTSVMKHVC